MRVSITVSHFTAYLPSVVEPSVKTEYVATLGTVAVIGTVTGPSIGALFSQIDTTIHGLPLNANNAPGFLIFVATIAAFVQVCYHRYLLLLLLCLYDFL